MKKLLQVQLYSILIFICFSVSAFSVTIDTTRIYGVSIDGINKINNTVTALSKLNYKPTTRIVFDWGMPASNYTDAVNKISNVSFIMGEVVDSYVFRWYGYTDFVNRYNEYVNLLDGKINIWEVGNEINGEWNGPTDSILPKLNYAYSLIKSQGRKAAITFYYNKNCYSNPQNEMFHWINDNISQDIRTNLDYAFISYYEDDCNQYQPNWQVVFDSLHSLFPNSKLGIGECGTTKAAKKEAYINKYYTLNVTTPNYMYGTFWWYFRQDCVPYTNYLWTVVNNAMSLPKSSMALKSNGTVKDAINSGFKLESNYPNPFNPKTLIRFTIPQEANSETKDVKLVVFDIQGKQIQTLLEGNIQSGVHEFVFDGSNLSSGIYYYKLQAGNFTDTKRMILIK